MPLILGITPHCNWQTFSPLFEQAGWAITAQNPETWYQTGWEKADESEQYLLIHNRPENAVAHAIAQGDNPEQALQAWLVAARAMVNFYKRHRKQAIMVHLPDLMAEPKSQLNAIAGHLHLSVQRLDQATPEPQEPPALELLMANQLVGQTPNIENLLAQIEACTLPLEGHKYAAPVVDITAVITNVNGLKSKLDDTRFEQQRLQAELSQLLVLKKKAEKERQFSLEQMHKVQSELEGQLQQNGGLKEQLASLQANVSFTQQENELLLEQLHLVQEELETRVNTGNRQENELAQREQQLQAEQAESRKIEQQLQQARQTDQALQAELKQTKDVAKKAESHKAVLENRIAKEKQGHTEKLAVLKQQSSELTKQLDNLQTAEQHARHENELLLEQLHPVQEELETQFNVRKQLENELAEYREHQDKALDAANREITRLQTQLNTFRSSTAWKATAPVRALKKPFRRASPEKKTIKKHAALVKQSGLFDEIWYLKTYPDVAEQGTDPIEHYLKFGAEERRNPSPEFDTDWYLSSYPDVVNEGANPLVHYIKFGQQEERATNRHHHPSLPAPGTA